MDRAGGAGELEEASTEKGHADGELSSAPARARAIGKGEGGVDQERAALSSPLSSMPPSPLTSLSYDPF